MTRIETLDSSRAKWTFWATWGAAFLGFPIGGAAATALVGPIETAGESVVGGVVVGAVVGAAQWLVLRRRLPLSPLWVAATAGSMAAGMLVGNVLLGNDTSMSPLLLRGLMAGAAIGLAQTAVLWGVLRTPIVWAVVVTLGWPLAWAVSAAIGLDLTWNWAVFGSSGALVFQLATGLTLLYLLRQPSRAPMPAPARS
jgi:hypothetical protein